MTNLTGATIGLKGRLRIQTKNVETGEWMQDSGWFDNLITNGLFDKICSNSNNANQNMGATMYLTHCALGTGTTPPAITDTTLGVQYGPRTSVVDVHTTANSGAPLYYAYLTKRFVFTQGSIIGNMTEVGIFNTSTGSTCNVHALLKDGAGNPTTMTVTAIEQVYLTYELRQYPTLTDYAGSIVISGITYDYVLRSHSVQAGKYALWITGLFGLTGTAQVTAHSTNVPLALTAVPGLGADTANQVVTPYVNGTYYSECEYTWGTAEANIAGGIGSFVINTYANTFNETETYGFYFTPKLDKTDVKQLKLKFRLGLVRV